MSSSALRTDRFEPHFEPRAVDVSLTEVELRVRLADGREVSVPLEWFPRLRDASAEARGRWRLIGGGVGVHWTDLDEDLSVAGLLAAR